MAKTAASVTSVPPPGPVEPDAFQRAHDALLADRTLQLKLPIPKPDPPPKPPPEWLKGVGEFFNAMGPVFSVVFWVLVIAGIALLVFFIVRALWGAELGWTRKAKSKEQPVDWRPDRERARVLLEDADALADQGRFDEAAHMLLLRGVADIIARRPKLIGPSLTSRDIAALPEIPDQARPAFAEIAELVERSWFGGRALSREGWLQARSAYERMIFAEAWR